MNTIEWTFQLRFAVALALGFLVGLERESTKIEHQKLVFGGVRTHPIISMFGFGCGWLYQIGVAFMLPAGLLALGTLTAIAYYAKIKGERFGSTSEISALLTFIMGALALLVDIWIAMAIGVINTILLSEKARLETYVENLNKVEFLATLKFLLVTLIILPVLPDQEYTQFHLNPAAIWKLVILVSTIGFVGYALTKKFGERMGLWLSGLLGGIVSSTAVTVAAGRIAQKDVSRAGNALQASLLAGAVMYIRILLIVSVVAPEHVAFVWWKFTALGLIGALLALRVTHQPSDDALHETPALQNPFEITPALKFAGLFIVLSVITALVRQNIGEGGIFGLSILVGISDIDPFILSLIHTTTIDAQTVVRAIILAMASNTVAKGIYFGFLVPSLRRSTTWRYGLWALLHIPLIILW